MANATDRNTRQRPAILPTPPYRLVVTGNYALGHFTSHAGTEHSDVEIRELAVECLRQLRASAQLFATSRSAP